jgi:hypothetical protein
VEPSRPIVQRGKTESHRRIEVAQSLGFEGRSYRFFTDYAGRKLFAPQALLVNKLSRYANHAAYVEWFEQTISTPLEAWLHADTGPHSGNKSELRVHYFGAYIGRSGATTHLVIAAALDPRGPKLINGFSVTAFSTADGKRYGTLDHIAYDPYSTPRKAKGAIPKYQIAPLL